MPKPIAIKASDRFNELPEKRKRAITKRADAMYEDASLDLLVKLLRRVETVMDLLTCEVQRLTDAIDEIKEERKRET